MLSLPVPLCKQHNSTIRSVSNILSMAPKGQLKITLWPSGDFTIGMSRPPKADKGDHPLGGIYKDAFGVVFQNRQPEVTATLEDQIKVLMKLIDLADARGDIQERDRLSEKLEGMLPTLGLVDVSNPHKKPRRYSRGGITSYGKKMVKSAATLLGQKYRGCVGFGTLTLPPLPPDELLQVCNSWGELARKFFQELRRELARQGLPEKFVYVSEIQPDRFKAWGQVCPHLHFLYVGKRKKWHTRWNIPYQWFPKVWSRLLSNLLGHQVEASYSSRVEKAKGNILKELGKYMSKGGEVIKAVVEAGKEDMLPHGYWGVQSELRKEVKRSVQTSCSRIVEVLVDSLKEFKDVKWLQYREIKARIIDAKTEQIREINVGFSGWIYAENERNLFQMCLEKWLFVARKQEQNSNA